MRNFFRLAALTALSVVVLPAAFAAPAAASRGDQGAIVIVFKDGHRQVYKLAEVARVEFEPPAVVVKSAESGSAHGPSRPLYLGKWEVGEGDRGRTFFITLEESGDAWRSLGNKHGKWVYVDGEARVTWDDGAQDAIRRVGSKYQKFAYGAGKSFTDTPDNVTDAHNTVPKPI
jgi:urease accessory protein UreE